MRPTFHIFVRQYLRIVLAALVPVVMTAFLSKSQDLIADGVHSPSDLVANFVVLFASHHCKKDADEDRPHGHSRLATTLPLRHASVSRNTIAC